LSGAVDAQVITIEELKGMGPAKLEKSALDSMITGATTESISRAGNKRSWDNMGGGRLVGRSYGGLQRASGTAGEGKWRIDDDGKYCVDIAWTGNTYSGEEKWCAAVVKVGDDHYAVFSKTAMKLTFKK
jgi:hypothetical protein